MGWATRWDYPSFFLRTCATAACTGRAGAEATKRASSLPEETWRCNGWMELRVTKRHQRYLSRIDQCCPFRALRGLVWVDVSANRVATVHTNAPLCNRRLTERRILDGRRHGKAHFACETRPKGAFCMRAVVAPRGRFRRSAYTPAYPRPLSRPGGATGPTTSRPHGPRDARAPGPEVHATGAVTQPPTHTSSRSLFYLRVFQS